MVNLKLCTITAAGIDSAWGKEMGTSFKRRVVRAGGWRLAKRLIKPIPIVGAVLVVGLAGYEIKRKGLLRGALDVGLDLTPVVGSAKGILEIFTGDLIPDRLDNHTENELMSLPGPPDGAGETRGW
jgi:hypothetical protein